MTPDDSLRLRLKEHLRSTWEDVAVLDKELRQATAKVWLHRTASSTLLDVEMMLRRADEAGPQWEDMWLEIAEQWLSIADKQLAVMRKALIDYGPDVMLVG